MHIAEMTICYLKYITHLSNLSINTGVNKDNQFVTVIPFSTIRVTDENGDSGFYQD